MPIQWYPGHMVKARRELAALLPSQDVIIEVVDARLPASSANALVTELRQQKPCVKVLAKSDLAEAAVTEAWLRHFEVDLPGSGQTLAIATTTERPSDVRTAIPELCRRLGLGPRGPGKPIRALIAGVPNVGKSTLINTLAGRAVAAVGDKPAVTRSQQQVVLKSGMILHDSPGISWPDIEDEQAALRLALAGSIPDTAIDYLNVGMFAGRLLLERYPGLLMARYKLPEAPASPDALLAEIGRRRGCLRSGGVVDLHKASEILVHETRSGVLGRISLEVPPPR